MKRLFAFTALAVSMLMTGAVLASNQPVPQVGGKPAYVVKSCIDGTAPAGWLRPGGYCDQSAVALDPTGFPAPKPKKKP